MLYQLLFYLFILVIINNCNSFPCNTISNNKLQEKYDIKLKKDKKCVTILSSTKKNVDDVDEITRKYGLEAGIWKAFKSGGKVKPGDLLKKYGAAYLITSITLAIISFAICYILVSKGIDVAALLNKIGIKSTGMTSGAGTFSIAYAIHKAASPIRFPPTVILTPIMSEWLQFPKKKQTK
jgi:hypothetical protein